MTYTKQRFASFEDYLTADVSDLPEGQYEYWDGELVEIMTESLGNGTIANLIFVALLEAGIPIQFLRPRCEVTVPGKPPTRFPDMAVIDEIHLTLLKKRETITQTMPPPRLLVEVVSPGNQDSKNYIRDYQDKPAQYAAIGVPEMWRIDPDGLRPTGGHRDWIQIGTLINGVYQFVTFTGDAPIVSPTFPELKLTAGQVLRAGR